jgi:hypothetical protein
MAFYKPDGSVIALGGKTGTGDQRFDVYGAGHRLIESRYVNRSATFVFNIGERFFGSMTAYVHGPDSAHYDFTSALPVQLLVTLAPSLMPMIEKQDTVIVPGLHVTTAAAQATAAAGQLSDGVATVTPATDGAKEEEVPAKSEAAKLAAAASQAPAPSKAAAEPVHAKPAKAEAPQHKAADAAAHPKAAGEAAHPKAVDAIRAKPAEAPHAKPAKPRADTAEQSKADPAARPKPPAVEEVLH